MNEVRPRHYMETSLECKDVLKITLTDYGFYLFCIGNAIKYLWRYEHKNGKEDVLKAITYLSFIKEDSDTQEYAEYEEFKSIDRLAHNILDSYPSDVITESEESEETKETTPSWTWKFPLKGDEPTKAGLYWVALSSQSSMPGLKYTIRRCVHTTPPSTWIQMGIESQDYYEFVKDDDEDTYVIAFISEPLETFFGSPA